MPGLVTASRVATRRGAASAIHSGTAGGSLPAGRASQKTRPWCLAAVAIGPSVWRTTRSMARMPSLLRPATTRVPPTSSRDQARAMLPRLSRLCLVSKTMAIGNGSTAPPSSAKPAAVNWSAVGFQVCSQTSWWRHVVSNRRWGAARRKPTRPSGRTSCPWAKGTTSVATAPIAMGQPPGVGTGPSCASAPADRPNGRGGDGLSHGRSLQRGHCFVGRPRCQWHAELLANWWAITEDRRLTSRCAMTEIIFYPAFSSSYSYFAAHLIDDLARRHGATVVWRPVRLHRIHEVQQPGGRPPRPEARTRYMRRDTVRIARLRRLPFAWPSAFPPDSDLTSELCYALGKAVGVRAVLLAMTQAVWGEGRAMRTAEEIVAGLAGKGFAKDQIVRAIDDPDGKVKHEAALAAALASGMFGAPWFVVDGEPFWGHDRLPYIDDWISTGRAAGRTTP
ncbi:MAG: 2-hydroxychromene-2-carboxylate isomerase [Alphaproteobacteria bacterium]|nr:2-hydroxychromene-2-carboxylate isomerase [Alphaproteobacteria bacterium]